VQPPGRGPAARAVGQGGLAAGEDLVEFHAQVGRAQIWRPAFRVSSQSTNPWVNPTQFSR
jgi:hypothetical protein